jgi:chaperonin GroES
MQKLSFFVAVLVCLNNVTAWIQPVSIAAANPRRRFSQQQHAATTSSTVYTLDQHEIRGPITPVNNIVLVKVKETLQATNGGILLPDQSKSRPTQGVVIAVGPGKIHPHSGRRIHNPINVGDSVLYGIFDGRPMDYNGEECQVLRDDDILLSFTGATMTLETVTPIRDYVLIELDSNQDDLKTASGVVIAKQVVKNDEPNLGRVVKIGEGRLASLQNLTPSPVQVGDYVKFRDYAGNEVMIEGTMYSVVKMVNILSTCTLKDVQEEATTESLEE